jgi:hypothetical protein
MAKAFPSPGDKRDDGIHQFVSVNRLRWMSVG